MAWAIINLEEMDMINPQNDGSSMTVPAGTVVNLIVYDGETPYNPGDNFQVKGVPDETKIGDFIGLNQ